MSSVPSQLGTNDGKIVASVKTSVTVEVSNESLKSNNIRLGNAMVGFLNSAPNVLKTSDIDHQIIKTKINNQINNDTQSIEGIEATNAIIGIELIKALKTVNASSYNLNQSGLITVETSSTCKPAVTKGISCDNTITIK